MGFGLATLSTGLDIFMTVHAVVTGGYPFYHPVEMFCIGTGTLASMLALLTVIVGKGKLRVPTAIASSITLFLCSRMPYLSSRLLTSDPITSLIL